MERLETLMKGHLLFILINIFIVQYQLIKLKELIKEKHNGKN